MEYSNKFDCDSEKNNVFLSQPHCAITQPIGNVCVFKNTTCSAAILSYLVTG